MKERAWKFLNLDRRLGYDDGRLVKVGVTLKVDGEPVLCDWGIHACRKPLDALGYANSSLVARVECSGKIVYGDSKLSCTVLTPLAIFDATAVLYKFARLCALDVITLWDAPQVVRQYLTTGDENLRFTACAAAWSTAYAACAAACDARDAAWDAACGAAWDAAWDAACAVRTATRSAATRSDARSKQNRRLERMLLAAMQEMQP